jgi:ABC-type phosphate transport system substrate-binding protein
MILNNKRKGTYMKIITLMLLLIIPSISTSHHSPPKVLVSVENESEYIHMNTYMLQKIFTRKIKKWDYNGQEIEVFTKPLDSTDHMEFVRLVLNMSVFSYVKNLEKEIYSGRATSITQIRDDDTMINKLSSRPNAIGYVNHTIYVGSKFVKIVDAL